MDDEAYQVSLDTNEKLTDQFENNTTLFLVADLNVKIDPASTFDKSFSKHVRLNRSIGSRSLLGFSGAILAIGLDYEMGYMIAPAKFQWFLNLDYSRVQGRKLDFEVHRGSEAASRKSKRIWATGWLREGSTPLCALEHTFTRPYCYQRHMG